MIHCLKYNAYGLPLGCIDTFEVSEGRFAIGGSRDPESDTNTKCREACISNSACDGYDFNTQDDACWIHTDVNNFNNLQIDNANVITNYQRVRCCKLTI